MKKRETILWLLLAAISLAWGVLIGQQLPHPAEPEISAPHPSAETRTLDPGEFQAYHLLKTQITPLAPGPACADDGRWKELPLIIEPGTYCIAGHRFELTEGGYRFYRMYDFSRYVIVNDGHLEHLLSGLAWLSSQGNRDEHLDLAALEDKARHSILSLRCGPIAGFAQHLLQRLGYTTRTVTALTLTGQPELGNQGHTLFEAWHPELRQWILVGLTGNRLFRDRQGRLLSAYETFMDFHDGRFDGRMDLLAGDPPFDVSGFEELGYDYDFFFARLSDSPEAVDRWYQRVFQGLVLTDGPEAFVLFYPDGNPGQYTRMAQGFGIPLKGLKPPEFLARFYGNSPDSVPAE